MLHPQNAMFDDLKPGVHLGIKVIATIGQALDWAAYAGPTDWSDQRVADEGDKISKDAAERLFDVCVAAGLTYRR